MSDLVEKLRFYVEHPDLSALLGGSPSACDDILQPILIAAFKALTEAEKREREARVKALEDLKLAAERVGKRDAYSDDVIKYAFQRGVVAAAKRFSSAVSTLQSEER